MEARDIFSSGTFQSAVTDHSRLRVSAIERYLAAFSRHCFIGISA